MYMTKNKILVAIILFGSLLVRIWRVPQLFYFGIDEEYQSTIAWSLAKNFHVIWIGVNSSVGFYLGPIFTYLNAFLFYLSKGDPIILGYVASLIGVVTTASILYIGKKLYNIKVGTIAGILYGFSAFIVFFDRRFWNPMPIPLISLWLFFSLIKMSKNTRWLIVLMGLMGLVYHLHLSLLIYWPFIAFVVAKYRGKIKISTWILAAGIYFILTSPLLVFDIKNHFIDLLMPLKFILGTSVPGRSYSLAVIPHLWDMVIAYGEIWNIIQVSNNFVIKNIFRVIPSCITLYILYRTFILKKNFTTRLLLLIIFFFSMGYIFFPGWVFKFYLVGCYPLISLIVSDYFYSHVKIKLVIPTLVLFIFINSYSVFTASPSRGLAVRKKLVQLTMAKLGTDSYELTCNGCNWGNFGGWRYLFRIYGKIPDRSKIDKLLGRYYPEEISSNDPKKTVVIVDSNDGNSMPVGEPAARLGPYRTYILDYK